MVVDAGENGRTTGSRRSTSHANNKHLALYKEVKAESAGRGLKRRRSCASESANSNTAKRPRPESHEMYDMQKPESDSSGQSSLNEPTTMYQQSTSKATPENEASHASASDQGIPQTSAELGRNRTATTPHLYTSEARQTDGPSPDESITTLEPPPVTAKTLSELDIPQIVNNPRLRHDVGFDPNLHFRPNLDGEKGRRKRKQNEEYWTALQEELQHFLVFGGREHCTCAEDCVPRKIPAVFEAVRDILKTLVPERDHPAVDQNIDVDLLMQQLERRVLNVPKLSVWLGQLLKGHCAPMRDGWVDDMVAQMEYGTKNDCIKSLVGGLKSLFGILETMKLDVANHQIRNLRVMLIADTVDFEQNYIKKRIMDDRTDARSVRLWYLQSIAPYADLEETPPVAIFLKALVHMLMPNSSYVVEKLPASFFFDAERLEHLRTDLREATCFKVCYTLFLKVLLTLKCRRDADISVVHELRSQILSILGSGGFEKRWDEHRERVALEIVRFAQEFTGSDQKHLDKGLLEESCRFLRQHVCEESSVFQELKQKVEDMVWKLATEHVEMFSKCSSLVVAERWVYSGRNDRAQMHWRDVIPGIAQRVARIGHLHWQVWGPLVYSQTV